MWRVDGCRLSRSSTRPAVEHRQAHVEHDRVRPELAGERQAGVAPQRDEPLEAALARDLELGAGEVGVVLDDQHDAVARLDRVAVVLDPARDQQRRIESRLAAVRRRVQRRRRRRQAGRDVAEQVGSALGRNVLDVALGQVEREGAALARGRVDVNLASEQPGDLAADREAEPGAAVAAARRPVRLLERFEDEAELVGARSRRRCRPPRSRSPARLWRATGPRTAGPPRSATRRTTPPLSVNLNAFERRFFSTCCRRCGSVTIVGSAFSAKSSSKSSALLLGDGRERPLEPGQLVRDRDLADVDVHLPGLHLREVEDVVDQAEQLRPRVVDRGRELDLLLGEVAVALSPSSFARISSELSGVRSSCDMFARNSDL